MCMSISLSAFNKEMNLDYRDDFHRNPIKLATFLFWWNNTVNNDKHYKISVFWPYLIGTSFGMALMFFPAIFLFIMGTELTPIYHLLNASLIFIAISKFTKYAIEVCVDWVEDNYVYLMENRAI